MFQSCVRGRAALWLAAALCVVVLSSPSRAGEVVAVQLDTARLIKLPQRATTVVIGNPLIADMSIEPGGLAVVTAKGYGATNVVVLDKDGAVLSEQTILVQGPSDPIVVVYRGVSRETYSCAPECLARVTVGDDSDYFVKTLNEGITRSNQAMAAGGK
jgi:Flp pilus assembly secretin CpaC